MKTSRRHQYFLPAALLLSFSILGAASATAQQLAYVSATTDESCSETVQVAGCTRGMVSVVNLSTNEVQATIDVWRRAERGRFHFRTIINDPTGSRLFVVLTDIELSTSLHSTIVRVFDTRNSSQTGELLMPSVVSHCAMSVDGARLFCGRTEPNDDIAVIDARTYGLLTTIPATFPTALALSPAGDALFVSRKDGQLAVYDTATFALLRSTPLPAVSQTMAVSADGLHLYMGLSNGSIVDIDPATNTILGIIPDVALGSNFPLAITFAGGVAHVATGGGTGVHEAIAVIDIASRTITIRIPVANPQDAAATSDGARVIVAREFGISTIDTATNQVVASTALPNGPGRLALGPIPPFAGLMIDTPSEGARLQQPFLLSGWAADLAERSAVPGIDTVHVWAYPANGGSPVFVGVADYFLTRSDVAAVFGAPYLNTGFAISVRGLSEGTYTLTAFGHSTHTGTFSVARQVLITIESSLRLAVDSPINGAVVEGSLLVAGWALDGQAVSGSGVDAVHVWAYPTSGAPPLFAGAASMGHWRPDVAAIYGEQFGPSGYALNLALPPGSYTLIIYGYQASTGMFAVERAVSVTVTPPRLHMFIDLPVAHTQVSGSVRVAGWALETGAGSGTGVDTVHVWAYPSSGGPPLLVGVASYGIARPDIAAVFGTRYTSSGFDVTGSLPPGDYDVVAFAHSSTTHTFAAGQTVRVRVR